MYSVNSFINFFGRIVDDDDSLKSKASEIWKKFWSSWNGRIISEFIKNNNRKLNSRLASSVKFLYSVTCWIQSINEGRKGNEVKYLAHSVKSLCILWVNA